MALIPGFLSSSLQERALLSELDDSLTTGFPHFSPVDGQPGQGTISSHGLAVAVEFRQAMAHGFLVTQGHMFCEGLHEGAVQMVGVVAATPDTHGGLSLLDSSVEALLLLEGMYECGLELLSEDARLP